MRVLYSFTASCPAASPLPFPELPFSPSSAGFIFRSGNETENEKNSVDFYTGLRDFVTDDMSRRTILGVLQEEMRHIRMLSESLEQYD